MSPVIPTVLAGLVVSVSAIFYTCHRMTHDPRLTSHLWVVPFASSCGVTVMIAGLGIIWWLNQL